MTSGGSTKIGALIRLLGDPDEKVARTVRKHFFDLGSDALPMLRQAGDDPDPLIRERVRGIVQEVQHRAVDAAFEAFAARPDAFLDLDDLEEGAFLIARTEYPGLDVSAYQRRLDEVAVTIAGQLPDAEAGRDPEAIVQTVGDSLFVEQGFSGNTEQYYEPDNSYLNRVLDRKTGIPITLSLLYLLLGRRLGLPFEGVGMPSHFIVKYEAPGTRIFLDPFSGGRILTIEECNRFLVNAGYGLKEEYLAVARPREVLARMIRNLVFIYTRLADPPRIARLTRYLDLLHRPHGAS